MSDVSEFPRRLQEAPGIAAETLRAVDWSKTRLGPPQRWPATLLSTLSMMLYSRHPMFLWWGPELISFYNDAYLPSFGVGKHPRAMGQPGRELWKEVWPIIGPQIDAVMQRAEPSWHEDHLVPIFRNGAIEDVYWTYGYSPVFDPGGKVVATLVVCTETTARVLAEQRLKEAHRQAELAHSELHDFLMQAPIGICLLDGPDHVFTLANPPYMTLLFGGRSVGELLGKPVRKAVPEVDGQGFFELLDQVYRTGEPFTGAKMPIQLAQPDGRSRELFVNFTYQAKRDATGHITGILAVIYEVTDQVNENREIELLAQNLQRAITVRDTFLGIASHELKTPLTSLVLQMQMHRRLLKTQGAAAFTPQKIERLIEHTATQGGRLSRLVDDMLDVSRINSGKLTMDFEAVDVPRLLDETIDRLAPQLTAAQCVLVREFSTGLVANADAYRVEQVVTNLLVNSIRYAPGTPVHVGAWREAGRVYISVRDEGPGIAAEDQQRIFERFERAASDRQASGLGLGLHIAKQIVEAHGGKLRVASEPGRGATFTFDVPPGEHA